MIASQLALPQTITITPGAMMRVSGLLELQKCEIIEALTIKNRRQQQAERFTGWMDPNQPEFFTGYALAGDDILIAPGALELVCRLLLVKYPGTALVSGGSWPAVPDHQVITLPGHADEPYQAAALEQVVKKKRGLIVGPCGSGKTWTAIRAMVMHGGRWIVVVHTKELTNQWADAIHKMTGVKPSVYNTKRKKRFDPESPFIIARVQGLREHLEDVEVIGRTRRGVIVDEAHHTPSDTFLAVLRFLDCPLRFGFTATPHRTMGDTELMHWFIGPEIFVIERAHTEAAGRTMRPDLKLCVTDYVDTYDPDEPGDITRLKQRMYADEGRLERVAEMIQKTIEGREAGIAITEWVTYGHALLERLLARGVAAVMCHAKQRKTECSCNREYALAAIDTGRARVLIATTLADEGLDIPRLDTCWQVSPTGNAGRCEQRWGRVARFAPGKKKPLVIHVVDPLVARTALDPQTGETKVHRIFVNQFRACLYGAYRNKADYNENAMRERLARWREMPMGGHRDVSGSAA